MSHDESKKFKLQHASSGKKWKLTGSPTPYYFGWESTTVYLPQLLTNNLIQWDKIPSSIHTRGDPNFLIMVPASGNMNISDVQATRIATPIAVLVEFMLSSMRRKRND